MKYINTEQKNASRIHRAVLAWFKKEHPQWLVRQEVTIEINGKNLFCDFMCESPFRFVVEIQGRQHFEYVAHFHGTPDRFAEQQRNDQLKKDWCEMNSYRLIEIKEDEFDESNISNLIMGGA